MKYAELVAGLIALVASVYVLCGCTPEPVALPYDNGIELPLRVCDERLIVQQVIRDVEFQIPGSIVEACPGNVRIKLEGAEQNTGGVAHFDDGLCSLTLTRVAPSARFWVLRHELGHCMNLADDDRNTAMRGIYRPDDPTTPEVEPMPSGRFSDRDRRYVRSRLP